MKGTRLRSSSLTANTATIVSRSGAADPGRDPEATPARPSSEEEVAELGRGRDDPTHVLGRKRQKRCRFGREAGGEYRLAREHRDIGGEGPPALGEERSPSALVDDVQGSAEDHVEGVSRWPCSKTSPASRTSDGCRSRPGIRSARVSRGASDRRTPGSPLRSRGVVAGHSLASSSTVTERTRHSRS